MAARARPAEDTRGPTVLHRNGQIKAPVWGERDVIFSTYLVLIAREFREERWINGLMQEKPLQVAPIPG
jgi:hypothetical protein